MRKRPRNLHVLGNNEFLQLREVIPPDGRGWEPPRLLGDAGSVAAPSSPAFVPKIRAGMYWKHHPRGSDCPQPPAASHAARAAPAGPGKEFLRMTPAGRTVRGEDTAQAGGARPLGDLPQRPERNCGIVSHWRRLQSPARQE